MQDRLLRALSVSGPSSAPALMAELGITQSTFSRLVQRAGDAVVVSGRARATRYAARRRVLGVDDVVAVYVVDARGDVRVLGQLAAVEPGFLWTPLWTPSSSSQGTWCADLPWFLQDARPTGFLGRLVPRRHQELGLPDDVRLWSSDHALRFITRHGHDLIGNLVVGDTALHALRQQTARFVDDDDYPQLAAAALSSGAPGSSAGGEQPKFLAVRDDGDGPRAVLVKWSPPLDSDVGRRSAELLICEHHAAVILAEVGVAAVRTRIVERARRLFLESERFDRVGVAGRRGVVSLAALDAEFVGSDHHRWTTTTAALVRGRRIGVDDHRRARFAACFGGVIGNSDMHLHNLSFFVDGEVVTGIAPIYDMLPMRYAPVAGEVVARAVEIVWPTPQDDDIAADVVDAGRRFWRAVVSDERIGDGLTEIALQHLELLQRR